VIEQILILQEERLAKQVERDKWVERALGFFIGVLSSVVASFVYTWIMNVRDKKIQREGNNDN
jgi:uncharacterized membrane protein YjfL (UPF0719 family)